MNKPEVEPLVYRSVRALGILRPEIKPQPQGRVFADKLDVIGTAFWLKDYKVLISCAHVVKRILGAPAEIGGLLVVGNRGNYLRALVDIIDFGHDLVVLRLPPDTPPNIIDMESAQGLEIAEEYPVVGSKVDYSGFPLGNQLLNSTSAPTFSKGVVGAQIRHDGIKKQIQISGTVAGGFSGAPIVLETNGNKLVAVLSNSPSEEAGKAGFFLGVSWEHVKTIAEHTRS